MNNKSKNVRIIGRHAKVVFVDNGPSKVKAKVDTGADSSSVWASNLWIDDKNRLHFTLFDKSSPLYTGKEIIKDKFNIKMVRSSNGYEQIRYSVKLRIRMDDWPMIATFTLADRSRNSFPILIGSRILKNKFLVDVSKGIIEDVHKVKSRSLTELSNKDPKKFFDKYYKKQDLKPEVGE
jgi:hypothetical protein